MSTPPTWTEADFDVVVIGAGHAGTEAAVAASRAGARVALVTSAIETIGHMSCNPAIGGVAKGTVVREVDALGGIMARATDMATVQFRMLNRGKGPAVWSPRAQCDRGLYRRAVRTLLEQHKDLSTIQGTVARILFDGDRVAGVETIEGRRFGARAVVVTSGTFLRGRMHIGTETRVAGGRAGEAPATHLAEQLEAAGLTVGRFKTGTPPRIDGRTVDFKKLQPQESEIEQFDYSWSAFWRRPRRVGEKTRHPAQMPCWITYAGAETKQIIADNIGLSAMYGGAIASRGPRYCPSVEDKIVRFPNAERHQLFLEPEGHETAEMYVNGMSTSLPASVQLEALRSVPGLENVRMTRPGYAIEYDYYPPTQLDATLAVKSMPGLYFAGQINGTTGYEEAAGQGLMAGLNAGLAALGQAPFVLGRETSYIAVLIDDLVTRGVDEPYRLFTSRSEFRLTVRQDNALGRLGPFGRQLNILYRPRGRHGPAPAGRHRRCDADGRGCCRPPIYGRGATGEGRQRPPARAGPGRRVGPSPESHARRSVAGVRRRWRHGPRGHDLGGSRDQVRGVLRARAPTGIQAAAHGGIRARGGAAVRGHEIAVHRGATKAGRDPPRDPGASRAHSRPQSQ